MTCRSFSRHVLQLLVVLGTVLHVNVVDSLSVPLRTAFPVTTNNKDVKPEHTPDEFIRNDLEE